MEYGKIYRFLKRIIRSLKVDQRQAERFEEIEDEWKNKRYWQGFHDGLGFAISELEDLREGLKEHRRQP